MLDRYRNTCRAIGVVALAMVWMDCGIRLPRMVFDYSINLPRDPGRELTVLVRVDRFPTGSNALQLYKGSISFSAVRCTDTRGRNVSLRDTAECFVLNLQNAVPPITFSYKAAIGKPGRHGHQGGIFEGLAVFDGEHSLMLPAVALDRTDDQIVKSIRRISVTCNVPHDWRTVVPFPVKRSGRVVSLVESPSYFAVSQLQQSCYAFGDSASFPVVKLLPGFSLAVDPQCHDTLAQDACKGILSLYDYFAGLFKCEPVDLTVLLLRKNPFDNGYIMGGVGLDAIATTFDAGQPRDWELLSHRFFHIFFDTRLPVSWFRRKPNLWLLEGLATYYENIALDNLPDTIRTSLKIDAAESFRSLARRYVYMRAREPRLIIAPMAEATLHSAAGTEFLHYTQAPLIVKLLEDQGTAKFGGHDRLLRFILDNGKSMTTLQPFFSFAITKEPESFAGRYLLGSEMLPVWEISGGQEDPACVVAQLNEFDRLIRSWIRAEDPGYSRIDSASADDVSFSVKIQGVHLADSATEMRIRNTSPTVYRLLLEQGFQPR